MEEKEGTLQGSSNFNAMNKSMNGNNLTIPGTKQLANTISRRNRQNSCPAMNEFSLHEHRPPIPIRHSIRRNQGTLRDKTGQCRHFIQNMEEDMDQYKENAGKFQMNYEKQKNTCDEPTEELLNLESKFIQLEKKCANQENLIMGLNHEHYTLSEELKDKSTKLAETINELNMVMLKSEDLAKKLFEFERQLQISENARTMELENLRSLQGSFQASEKHFASILEQVQSLIQENELAYESGTVRLSGEWNLTGAEDTNLQNYQELERDNHTNCKLTQEKLKIERDLNYKNTMSTSLTTELAEAQEKMKQINHTLKSFEHEKACLFKKINKFESDFLERTRQLEAANQEKADLEGQLKLANLCLSRALSANDKANILPQKNEVKMKEPATPSGASLSSFKTLQEEIATKDIIISRLIEENKNLEVELLKYKMEFQKQQEIHIASHGWYRNIHGEPKDLDQEMQKRERIIDSMKLTIEKAISDRNRLGLKCIRRKEQAVLLKEKNKVLEEIMLIGNRLYEEGLKKIRNMKMAQESAFGSTLSLVGIVSGGNQPATPSLRQIMMHGTTDGLSAASMDVDSAQNSGDSYDYDGIMNI